MRIFKYLFLFFAFAFNANLAMAWENMPPADKESILKILTKAAIEKIDIKNIRLSPRYMNPSNDWIYIKLDIQDATGKPLEYPKGHDLYLATREDPYFNNTLTALLRKNDGNWELIDTAFNDNIPGDEWDIKHNAPKHIFFNIACPFHSEDETCKRLNQVPAAWQGTWYPPAWYPPAHYYGDPNVE